MKKCGSKNRIDAHLRLKAFAACLLVISMLGSARAAEPLTSSHILHELRNFREMGSVLYIAAHPDDENNQLLAYLARGRGYRTGYLSLTRGEGGQNLIGTEQREELGVLRTQELLAARRIDGAEQFFTSAIDFGFSKDYREGFKTWDRQRLLGDIVRIIRAFRPDVLITRFSTEPGRTHGHHTASAILALEAFKLAGDREAFPEQLAELTPWQPKRILWNVGLGPSPNGTGAENTSKLVQLDTGGYEPLLGESYGEIGTRSRSMHKSQGMVRASTRGSRSDYFTVVAGDPVTRNILDGVDTTWGRLPGGVEVGRLGDQAIAQFNPEDPAASVPVLLTLQSRLAALPMDTMVAYKRQQLNHILQSCLGLYVETVVPEATVVPGETLKLRHTVIARAGFPIRWRGVRYPSVKRELGATIELTSNQPASLEATQVLPADSALSQPYWLREEGTAGMYRIDDPGLAGRAENPPVFPVEHVFELNGQTLVIADQAVQVLVDPAKGEIRRSLEVVPPVSLSFNHDLELFAPGSARPVVVEVSPARAGATGTLKLDAPAGWKVTPATQFFRLATLGESARFTFTVTAPARPATAQITVIAEIDGVRYHSRRVEIRYDHIPTQLLQPPARLKAVSIELAIRGRRVGYLPGAGDLVAESLQRMGYEVTLLSGTDLIAERLGGFDAIVMGIRALNTRTDLAQHMSALFAYVEAGGNLIMQYNTPDSLHTTRLAPYDLKLSSDRVTDANAPVTLLVPGYPAFTSPNRIVPADFDGWVQERGRNFPREWDAHFTPLLAFSDYDESPKTGSLLVAHFGRGYFVYTGLSLFRQLPEGVPGAYRLFANLLSLGKAK
jgi:LmbE family N-acetylglucosaminyl deacetylase